jgi:hypothetical protein
LAGITDMDAANRFIAASYLAEHNRRFAVVPAEAGSAFVPAPPERWADVLCLQHERIVGNDNTVSIGGLRLQIPAAADRAHFVRAKVRVNRYGDGTYAIFHGPRRLASYDPAGGLIEAQKCVA